MVDMYTHNMPEAMGELDALGESIKEHAVEAVGMDNLQALLVHIDWSRLEATVSVALEGDSDEAQLEAFRDLREVQLMFLSEVTMNFEITTREAIVASINADQRQAAYV